MKYPLPLKIANIFLICALCSLIFVGCGQEQPAEQPQALTASPKPVAEMAQVALLTPTPIRTAEPVPPPLEVTSVPKPTTNLPASTHPPEPTSSIVQPPAEPIEAFFEESYKQLLMRDPELLTELGLAEAFGSSQRELTNISPAYIQETHALQRSILETLHTYDRDSLSPDQQVTYDVYEWSLEDLVEGQAYWLYDYPVTHFITGVQNQMLNFFTDIHPITSRQDAEDYIARLSQVDTKFDQLVQGLELRQEAGAILPRFIIQWVLYDLRQMANASPQNMAYYTSFAAKLEDLDEHTAEDQQALLTQAQSAIETSVLPGYQNLVAFLEGQQAIATDEDGVWKFPEGEAYYAYTLRHHTSTGLTAVEIHELGLRELERIQTQMDERFAALGYPAEEGLPELFARVAQDGGTLSGDEVVTGYETIIQAASREMDAVFDQQPQAEVVVIGGPTGGYYVPPAVDGSRPGAFYAGVQTSQPRFSMPTLAYHEAIPGHHFQIGIAQELDLPLLRKAINATAYTEGWALYAEQLAWELGFYAEDPYGDLGRLQAEAFRAARLVVDTGLHDQRWSYAQAVDFMHENTGLPRDMVEFEVSRYIVWPGQATAYKIGMLEILELRRRAQEQLGEDFNLKEFHNAVLGSGSMPLDVLERVVEAYIADKVQAKS